MSIASLTKFTVPLTTERSTQGLLMPKLPFRFRAIFENFGRSSDRVELTKQIVSFARPSVTFADMVIDVYNSKVKLAGKPEWAEIAIVLRDDATGNVSRLVGEQLQYQFDFYEQASAASGSDYKFVTRLEMLDGGNGGFEPTVLETWEMYGCYISAANYNEVSYAGTDPVTISLTMKFDNALQTPLSSGVGGYVGRTQGDNTTL